jgi:hypothetical protein
MAQVSLPTTACQETVLPRGRPDDPRVIEEPPQEYFPKLGRPAATRAATAI